MGRVFSSLKREAMNYNIDNKASKFLSKNKPIAAPKHPSTIEQIKILKEEQGVNIEDISKKDEKLNEHLRNLYVVSEGPALSSESTKALPLNRASDWSDMQYGYREPEIIPAGKISLKRALELLSKHHEDSEKWTYDNLAKHYNLNVKFVETLVDRYRVLQLHLPTTEEKEKSKDKSKTYAQKVQMQLALQNIHKLGLISTKNKQKILPPPPVEEIKPT